MNVKGSRLRIGLVTGALLLVFAAMFVGSARATTPPATSVSDPSGLPATKGPFDPLSTNVPYLAWRGELVRLVGCLPYDQNSYPGDFNLSTVNESNSPINGLSGSNGGLSVQVDPYAFSGPEDDVLALPKPVSTPNAHVFYDHANDRICVRSDWISDKPGILIAKLTVSYGGVILIQRDFMVGWMAINSATMTNAGTVSENPGTEPGNSANTVVTGAIPLNEEFQSDWGLTPGTCSYNGAAALPSSQTWQCLVMPRDWALWAQSGMASANMPYSQYDYCKEWSNDVCVGGWVPNPYYNTDPSAFWDIHDSSAPAALGVADSPDVHVLGFCTAPGTVYTSNIDQVDNCNGGEDGDVFSRLFGDSTSDVGPFDPAFASTLLSDGRLNAADAPMPALEIIYNTAGGMGYFDNSCLNDKDNAYNANFDPTNINPSGEEAPGQTSDCIAKGTDEEDPHALYAPYYSAFIPSTSRDNFGAASGIDSAYQTDNFKAFAGWSGEYNFWQIANTLTSAVGADSGCLLNSQNTDLPFGGDRSTNDGPTKIVEFTDEHGEARAQWQPGLNADFFANYANNNGKGGCDIQGVTFPHQSITASAQYPYQPTANPTPVTGSVTKVIANLFQKTLSCVAERNPDGSITGYICTVTAQDIDGNGSVMNGETVCLHSQGSAGDGAWYNYSNGQITGSSSGNSICVTLSGGDVGTPAQAQADLLTTQGTIDITSFFQGEKIIRDACVVYGASGSVPTPCGAIGSGTTTSGTTTSGTTTSGTTTSGTTTSGTTTSGTTTSGTTTGGGSNNTAVKVGKAAGVAAVRIVTTRHGRVLYVKVISRHNTAKIRVTLKNSKGHVLTNAVRSVRTKHMVQVKNLRISAQVKRVNVSLVK